MISYLASTIKDISKNGYLNAMAVGTIALCIFIISVFGLSILNAADMIGFWKNGIRIMAYLKKDVSDQEISESQLKIKQNQGVRSINFISKEKALDYFEEKMKGQASLLANLKVNPLPDAFEIGLDPSLKNIADIERLARQVESDKIVADVEYGQVWLKRFSNIFNLFRLAAFGIGGLVFLASVFIIGNTIRLVLYSRVEEIEIMRLVGASESFIKRPFYVEGILLGALGGFFGIMGSFIIFLAVSQNISKGISSLFFEIRFFPMNITLGIFICSILIGWLGCFLSLKQFLKTH